MYYDHLLPRPEVGRQYDCFDSTCLHYCMARNAVLCLAEITDNDTEDAAGPNLVSCMEARDVKYGMFIDDELTRIVWMAGDLGDDDCED